MNLVSNMLTTHPIQAVWEVTIQPCPCWRFRFVEDSDRQFCNCSVWIRTRTRSNGPEPWPTVTASHPGPPYPKAKLLKKNFAIHNPRSMRLWKYVTIWCFTRSGRWCSSIQSQELPLIVEWARGKRRGFRAETCEDYLNNSRDLILLY